MTMTISLMGQLVLGLLCIGVIAQTMRLMRRLQAVSDGQMGEIVTTLDRATGEARLVLDGLRTTLRGEGAELARNVVAARGLAEELEILIGIADAKAERLSEAGKAAASASGETPAKAETVPAQKIVRKPRVKAARGEPQSPPAGRASAKEKAKASA